MLAANLQQCPLDNGIKFLDAEHFIQSLQELQSQFLRERKGRGHLQQAHVVFLVQGIQGIHIADAMGSNAFPGCVIAIAAVFPFDCVAGILRQHSRQFPVALFNEAVVLQGQARENHPAGGILHKALHGHVLVLLCVFDLDGLITVVHPGGAAEKDRRMILLGKIKSFLYHLIGFRHGGRVKDRHLGKLGKGPSVLLCLRRDRTGVICNHHHQAAFDTHVFQTHQGVRSDVQPNLLHGHHGPGAAIGRPCRQFHGSFLVD